MKKNLFIKIIILILAVSIYPNITHANKAQEWKTIYQQKEKDLDSLYSHAKKSATGIKNTPESIKSLVDFKVNGKSVQNPQKFVKVYSTVQKLKTSKRGKCIKNKYKKANFALISSPEKENVEEDSFTTLSDGSDTKSDYDGSLTVKGTNVIYYDTINCNDVSTYKFTKISTKWERLDPSIYFDQSKTSWENMGNGYDETCDSLNGVILGNNYTLESVENEKTYTWDTHSDTYVFTSPSYRDTQQHSSQEITFFRDPDSKQTFSFNNTMDP